MKRKIILSLIILVVILMITTTVNAAIEIKPGGTVHTKITVTNSYQYCYDMRSSTSTLGNNSLDPHLTLNADWGAVTYLGASPYGNLRSAYGEEVTIGENTYTSTTNNITGVLNFGKTEYTQTASLLSGFSTSTNRANLENNANTKYVEILTTNEDDPSMKGFAFGEIDGWFGSYSGALNATAKPVAGRVRGAFGYTYGMTNSDVSTGNGYNNVTYRPVIWN